MPACSLRQWVGPRHARPFGPVRGSGPGPKGRHCLPVRAPALLKSSGRGASIVAPCLRHGSIKGLERKSRRLWPINRPPTGKETD